MRPDRDLDQGVAGGAARGASLALALQAQRAAVLRACRDGDLHRAPAIQLQALLAALSRGEEVDLEAVAAVGAAPRLARPGAPGAGGLAPQVFEAELGLAAAGRTAEAAPEGAAEHLAEDAFRRALRIACELEPAKGLPRPSFGVDLAAIILGPLHRVGQKIVGLAHFLEALLRPCASRVAIRMQHLGELTVGLLDRGLIGAARHVQGAVRIHLDADSGAKASIFAIAR